MTKDKPIQIDRPRDIIIIEKMRGTTVKSGTRFYCGYCGGVLGRSDSDLEFPCHRSKFLSAIRNDHSLIVNAFGTFHTKCGHFIHETQEGYYFMALRKYLKAVQDDRTNTKTKQT